MSEPPRRARPTPFQLFAAVVLAVGVPLIAYRFWAGLGAVTNLTQATPWGLWVGLDVASGVALAAGGYTVASAVYIFGLERYRPIVRPALLTGFLGYLFVVIGLIVDLGRPWKLPVPIVYSHGYSSVLFEVAWCVTLYALVLALEVSPAVFEWLGWPRARRRVLGLTVALTVLGVVLSTLHQSSLGSLFLMAKGKLHPLWYSPFIPVQFFVSSIVAGLSMVILEAALSRRAFQDQHDPDPDPDPDPARQVDLEGLSLGLARAAAVVLFAYFFTRVLGVVDGGALGHLGTRFGALLAVELLGFVALPAALFAHGARHGRVRQVRLAAALGVLGVVLNRFIVSFVAFNWERPERYVPHWLELVVSLTLFTALVLAFRWFVTRTPILAPHPAYVHSEDAHG